MDRTGSDPLTAPHSVGVGDQIVDNRRRRTIAVGSAKGPQASLVIEIGPHKDHRQRAVSPCNHLQGLESERPLMPTVTILDNGARERGGRRRRNGY